MLAFFVQFMPSIGQDKNDIEFLRRFSARLEFSQKTNELTNLRIESNAFTNDDFGVVIKFKAIDTLHVRRSKVTDDGLKNLNQLPNLQYLILNENTNLRGTGFANFTGNKTLKTLMLRGCPISDEGVQSIAKIESLVSLNLAVSKVTNKALKSVDKLDNLESLWLTKTAIDNTGLKYIKGPSLRALLVGDTSIDDEAVKTIAGLPKLAWLDISGTKVTDNCVDDLLKINGLQILDIRRTRISVRGVNTIRNRFPKASIEFGDK
jgi:Leucine-rich repeat (LRR) protein